MAGSTNVQGEDVKKLDVLSNELFVNMLSSSYTVNMMVSEENETVIEVRTIYSNVAACPNTTLAHGFSSRKTCHFALNSTRTRITGERRKRNISSFDGVSETSMITFHHCRRR